jgi:monoamine oxidase
MKYSTGLYLLMKARNLSEFQAALAAYNDQTKLHSRREIKQFWFSPQQIRDHTESRVHFAGEHTSTLFVMEGAAQSGVRAAREVGAAA